MGILNRSSGYLTLHSDQKDHFDDDVLDDLAQEVLSRGGEVVLTARQNIPGGRLVLAILQTGQLNISEIFRNNCPKNYQTSCCIPQEYEK